MPLLDDADAVYYGSHPIKIMYMQGKEVWPKRPVTVTGTAPKWDTITLTIVPPMVGADSYVIRRNGQVIAPSHKTLTFTDQGAPLVPETEYEYTVEAIKNGARQSLSLPVKVSTPKHGALNVTHSQLSWNYVLLSWTDTDQGSIDKYSVYRNDSTFIEDSTSSSDKAAGIGLAADTNYSFTVRAYRGSTEIPSREKEDFKTPARAVSTWSATDGRLGNYSWTGSTAKSLRAADLNFQKASSGWVTSFNLMVHGDTAHHAPTYPGRVSTGRFEPFVGGHYLGYRDVAGQGYPYKGGWTHVDGSQSAALGRGNNAIGFRTPQSTDRTTQWYAYDNSQDTHGAWGTINTAYYTDQAVYDDMRSQPWWDEVLVGRPTHTDSWLGENGEIVAERIYDKETNVLLVSWGEIPPEPTQFG